MRSIEQFFLDLGRLDIKLSFEEGRLSCDAPKGEITAEIRTELTQRKTEMIQFLKKKRIFEQPIPCIPEKAVLPISFAQQRLWFLTQLELDGNPDKSATYNMPTILRIEGNLDYTALQTALEALVKRHESLRLYFPEVNGEVSVRCLDVYDPLTITDLSHTEQSDSKIQATIDKHSLAFFDPSTGPLFRTDLFKLTAEQHILLFNMHHIISDGWSIDILIKEWTQFYTAFSRKQKPRLPELQIQYSDYAIWQRSWLEGEILQHQLDYWGEKLTHAPELLNLPIDYQRPGVMGFEGNYQQSALPPQLSTSLKQLSQQHGMTLFMTLLGAFNILLYRYSGQDDILVGSPIANRTHHQTEDLIGFFVNTLVFRTHFAPQASVLDLLKQVQQTALEAYNHQDIPFEYLVEQLKPTRSLSHSPLFQVMFALHNAQDEAFDLPNLKVNYLKPETTTAKFDLVLTFVQQGDDLTGYWEYRTDLFRPETITQMTRHFQILLQAMVDNPDNRLSQLALLTEAEKRQLIAWNQTHTNYVKDRTVIDLFEAQVKKTPHNMAVAFEQNYMAKHVDKHLSYQQLNKKANQLAHYLMDLGVGTETLVGICVERSVEMVIGLLGILKAGGAYIPIDPDYPQQRVRDVLEDSQVSILLSQRHLSEHLSIFQEKLLYIDKFLEGSTLEDSALEESSLEEITTCSDKNPVRQSQPFHLAYVIYTSGSTGKPKGVMVEHHSLTNLIYWHREQFAIDETDKATLLAGVAFDASTWELWPYLSVGACVYPVKSEILASDKGFKDWLEAQQISIAFIPTPLLENLLTQPWDSQLLRAQSLKKVLTGGDTLHTFLPAEYHFKLYNNYGPTENTIVTTSGRVPHINSECHFESKSENYSKNKSKPPSIGRPIANTQIFILDKNNKLTPPGIPGELCIGGEGLARGYLNHHKLTSDKFIELELFEGIAIPRAATQETSKTQRIYKTGDLARWLPDGSIQYLGRLDNQVKLRGFRIELGEIEAILLQHESIKEGAVVLYDQDASPRLAAYITLTAPLAETDTTLRTWVNSHLPQYMVPSSFTVLEKMPVTANGKIDRKALPIPALPALKGSFEAARSQTEQQLVDIWQHILKQTNIGISDNFFERGGDSILSIQIVAHARSAGLELSARDLFQHQTIADLARIVRKTPTFHIEQSIVSGEVPLTPIQRAFFGYQPEEPWHFNQAILLNVPHTINSQGLKDALAAIIKHHDALRLQYQADEVGNITQYYTEPNSEIPFYSEALKDLSLLQERVDIWQANLNLEQSPLVRLVLFQTKTQARLLWCIHHLVVDAVSWRILLEDLQTAYHQSVNQQAIHLPKKTSSFKAWSECLQRWKDHESFQAEDDYWSHLSQQRSQQLSLQPKNSLPIDNPAGRNRFMDMEGYTIRLNKETTQHLLIDSPAAYHTQINDILLTALMVTLHEWTGNNQQLIDLESHGRMEGFQEIDLSRTVGWFTSLFSVLLELPPEAGFDTALKSIKEQLRAVPNEGVGYGVLRHIHGKKLSQGQFLFNYLGQYDQSLQDSEFGFAKEDSGRPFSLKQERTHLIEINGEIVHNRLSLTWSYSREQYKDDTIRQLAENYQKQLTGLIDFCRKNQGYTPSDFPLAGLKQEALDNLAQIYANNIADIYPLSPMQQGMLFHSLYKPETGMYFTQLHCVLRGHIDPQALQHAWQYLLDRHTILRTAFLPELERPLQLVTRHVQLPWEYFDWSDCSSENNKQQLETLLSNERNRGFNLNNAPLTRIQLIRETDERMRLVWNYHHLLIDGWCLSILFTELLYAYQTYQQGHPPQLPTPIPYRDYILWLNQQDQQAAKTYWQNHLRGIQGPTTLPIARHSDQPPNYQELTHTLELAPENFSRSHHLTLNTLVQGAWAALLHRYTGEKDIIFGVTTSGRHIPLEDVDKIMGLFINTLPLRVKVTSDEVLEWLRDIQQLQQQNNQYSYVPLADIQSWSEATGGVSLFESILVFENYPYEENTSKASLQITDIQGVEYTNYPLTLVVVPDKQLYFRLIYDANRYQKDNIKRMLTHLGVLVEGMVNNPQCLVSQLPLLTESEQQQLSVWNQTDIYHQENQTVVDLFQAQVEKTPDKIAAIFEGQQLSYKELNEQANQLAHYLMNLGVRAETLVGICVERCLEMVIGMLGILKAGGAYVPLDPDYPKERLKLMIEGSKLKIILSQSHLSLIQDTAAETHALVLNLDKNGKEYKNGEKYNNGEKFKNCSKTNPLRQSRPENLAYVIYTSGSTGVPKGVMIQHANLLSLLYGFNNVSTIKYPLIGISVSRFHFDVSIWELFINLCFGGTLHIIDLELLLHPINFVDYLLDQQINCLFIPPALLEQVVIELEERSLEVNWQSLLTGVEPIQQRLLQRYRNLSADLNIIIGYGPTETTVCATFYPFIQMEHPEAFVPIGKPVQGYQVYLLDSNFQAVPLSIPGEICVAGAGLARGYLNRPELTASKFIEIPSRSGQLQRIYRTGDQARWLPNGNIEFIGRFDHQVKIRGFRVELGEIEAILGRHESVKKAVVILYKKNHDTHSHALTAYITLIGSTNSQPKDEISRTLRGYLQGKLPDHMIPSFFTILDKLPLTPNGKIDRKALPEPDLSISPAQFKTPGMETEHLLSMIWSQVLGIAINNTESNFFEIGGHSLLATRLASLIRSNFNIEIPLKIIFEKPRMTEQARWIDRQQRGVDLPPITPQMDNTPLALSFAQQRMWFLSQLESDDKLEQKGTYNIPAALRLSGPLNENALQEALISLIEQHACLRMCFPSVDGEASIKLNEVYNPIRVKDLRDLSEAKQPAELQKLLQSYAEESFDLNQGPLLRLHIFKLGKEDNAFLFNTHHIISDGWSMGLLIQQWSQLYSAYSQHQIPKIPELAIQYTDYAAWQRNWLQGKVLQQQLSYWSDKLQGIPELLEIPTDYPRPSVKSYRGKHLQSTLTPELTKGIKALSQQQGATVFMTLLAGFKVLLSRYSGQTDLVVGSPIANRGHHQTEDLIGFFVNTLALRTQINQEQGFLEYLKQVKQTALEAYTHQDIPFEYVVEKLNPSRSMSHSPLFQVMFVLQNTPQEDLKLKELTISPLEIEYTTAKFDLTLNIVEHDHRFYCDWEYSTDLFSSDTITRMTQHFQVLLEGIIKQPEQPIFQLPLLTESEKQQLLAYNQTKSDYPQNHTIVDLFQNQVEQRPNNIALVFEGEQLTYKQLNTRANQLAHYLLSLGIKTENLIGICVERSLEMVIGVLGILKAGAAYVPLDPDYPLERLQFILDDSQVPILLTQKHLDERLPTFQGNLIYLDQDWETITSYSDNNPLPQCNPDNLSYVIYTSGSTGKPKGCQITHYNVARLFAATNEYYHFNQNDVWTLFHSYAFDFSVWELWGALLYGGKLVVVPYFTSRTPEDFYKLLITEEVTVLNQTPSAFSQLIQVDHEPEKLALRLVIFGGETLDFATLQAWYANHNKQTQLVNMYGITETTVHVTYYPLKANEYGHKKSLIGHPISDLQVWILDSHQQPVSIGLSGEMYVGGPGLARAYLNRPQITQERFIEAEILGKKQRLYKTGDLARWLPDKNGNLDKLEYLGRLDHQVKLRGFRIELGEIEATLGQYKEVKEAILIVNTQLLLIAYVTLTTPLDNEASILHSWLKTQLPQYMLPARIITLEKMPLTANGKIDRQALKNLSNDRPISSEENFVPANTPEEELLSGIWSQVLGLNTIGVKDNFFDSGGHSLLATQVASRIRENFQVNIPLRILFEHPTIHAQAEWLSQQQQQQRSAIPTLARQTADEPRVLSFAQQRLWFLDHLEADGNPEQSSSYNMPVVLQLEGKLNQQALQHAFSHLVKRHEDLRLYFPSNDGQAIVQIMEPYDPFVFTDLSDLSNSKRQNQTQILIENHAQTPFKLATGPLFSTHLIRLNAQQHILLMNMHHIISDGWSIGILIGELNHLYNAYSQNQEPKLAPLTIQYTDYAAWQRKWLEGEILEHQLRYWKEKLADPPELLELPTDYPRPAVMRYKGRLLQTTLPTELVQGLHQFCREQGVTLYMLLLTTFNILLYRYSGQKDILIGTPIANRPHYQTENLIGFFINTLVLRGHIQAKESVIDLLKQLRQSTLEAYGHQDIPFEYLVEQLNPVRTLSHSPLFQVMLVLQNAPLEEFDLLDLKVSSLEQDSSIAKFDLTLSLEQQSDTLLCSWKYNTDLFRPQTIERMTKHFQVLLESLLSNPEQSILQLPLLTKEEQQQLIQSNLTESDYPKEQTIIDLFQEQVEKTPDNIAVVFENQSLSYRDLNTKANQLAHYLMTIGVSRETLVGICVDRSLDMVVGLLGILKAGAAYVPLDPNYPEKRLQFMLEDSKVSVLLSQSHLQKRLSVSRTKLIYLDKEWEAITAASSGDNPVRQGSPQNLAYVIYTSGSSGMPKGVMVEHLSLYNLLQWMLDTFTFSARDKVLQKTPFSFDASIWEFYLPLLFGGTLVVAKPDGHQDPEYLTQTILEQQVTILHLVPSLLKILLEHADFQSESPLRYLFCGGESLDHEVIKQFYQYHPQSQLYNLYGPTEATIDVTYWLCNPQASSVAIGRPIANTQIYILDENLNPTPVGVPGELCIAGKGLARAYLNNPTLTKEKFLDIELFGEKQRIYKTGDLARWLPDTEDSPTEGHPTEGRPAEGHPGNIEYLNRLDHQIKLRGFRIELGEIEAILREHKKIKEAVVILSDQTITPQLAAYITTKIPVQEVSTVLNEWLKNQLPDYMIPSTFTVLDTLPLTTHGKIDRKALPTPELVESTSYYEAPRTTMEQKLLEVWESVLKLNNLGIHDNFFERGGDSILAIQMVAKAKTKEIALKPRDLFQYQTISSLARAVRSTSHIIAEQGIISGEAPLTPIQEHFFAKETLEPWHYNQSVLLEAPADINADALRQALTQIIQHHDSLRLHYRKSSNHWQQWYGNANEDLPFHTEDLSNLPVEQQKQTLEQRIDYWQTRLNLETGPLCHFVVIYLNEEVRLFWTIHHLAVDAVSWNILLEDLQTAYYQVLEKEPIELPPKTSSFKTWAEHLLEWKNSNALELEAQYWQNLPPVRSLPMDYPGESNQLIHSEHYTISLEREITQNLLNYHSQINRSQINRSQINGGQSSGSQINSLFITALSLSLQEWTEQRQYLIDMESHGRADELFKDIDLSRTVGWFTSLYTVYLELPDSNNLKNCFQAVQEQLNRISYNGIAYGVSRYLKKENLPQGQILFNYLGQIDQGIHKNGVFCFAEESTGEKISLKGERNHNIAINGYTLNKQLNLTWSYNARQYKATTIQTLAENFQKYLQRLIEPGKKKPHLSPLLPLNEKGNHFPLYCLPGLGGIAGYFQPLTKYLGAEQPLYGLQSPGLDSQTEIPISIEALATHQVKIIQQCQPEGPYYLAGHSFGCIVALEMAHQLEQSGASIGLLAMFDQPSIKYTKTDKDFSGMTELDWTWDILTGLGLTPPFSKETMQNSKNPEYYHQKLMNWVAQHHINELLYTPETTPETFNPDDFQRFVQVHQAEALTLQDYQPVNKIVQCPIHLFCTEDSLTKTSNDTTLPEHWGWAEHTLADIKIHHVPGAHTTMIGEPHVKTLATQLGRVLIS